VRLLRRAAGLQHFFRLDSPFAASARFCGGMDAATEFRPAGSYAGRGHDLGGAFMACIGEAAEFSAMYRRPDDPRVVEDGVEGRSLVSGKVVRASARDILRDGRDAAWPSSTGYAAGATMDDAIQSAFLECVERDAIARWYLGEHRPAAIEANAGIDAILGRAGRTGPRNVQFADLSPPGALARTVVAISTDEVIGTAFGFGAAFLLQDACAKALLELCQGEIGLLMIARKRREAGDGSLVDKEHEAIARAMAYRPGHGRLDFGPAQADVERSVDFTTLIRWADAKRTDIIAYRLTVPGEDIAVAKVTVEGCLDAAILPVGAGEPKLL
jgi:ribosomal protein S12 methylthiotransferase accessory factor YcaO